MHLVLTLVTLLILGIGCIPQNNNLKSEDKLNTPSLELNESTLDDPYDISGLEGDAPPLAVITPDLSPELFESQDKMQGPFKITEHNTSHHQNFVCGSEMCSKTLTPDENATITLDGALNLKPGDRLCLKGGSYQNLKISALRGLPNNPIEITNCDGPVNLTGHKNSIQFTGGSAYLKVLGSGHKLTLYGFKIDNVSSEEGISVSGKSRDIEISYVSISNVQGMAALVAKSEPISTSDPIDYETGERFILSNLHLHHIYVNKTKDGDGFLIGSSRCSSDFQEFKLKGIEIHDNVLLDVGASGILVGCGQSDVKIHHNFLSKTGWRKDQKNGLHIAQGTTAKVYKNWIENVQGTCVHMDGGQSDLVSVLQIHFYENTVKNCENLFYLNHSLTRALQGKTLRIENNKFENNRMGDGVGFVHAASSIKTFPMEWINNQFIGSGGASQFIRYDSNFSYESYTTLKSATFIDNSFEN